MLNTDWAMIPEGSWIRYEMLLDGYNLGIIDVKMKRDTRAMHWQQKVFAARR